jgi:hypothetical protein
MRVLLISLFLFIFNWSFGQNEKRKYFPDTTEILGISNHFQPEDIYTCLNIQLALTQNWLIETGLGIGWRHNRTKGYSIYSYVVGSYDFMRRPRLFLGPSIRGFYGTSYLLDGDIQFRNSGGQMGYRLAYGKRLKIIHSAYLGVHNFTFRTGQKLNNKVYLGHTFQIGLGFEI